MRGAAQFQVLLADGSSVGPVRQQGGQNVPGVQDPDGLVHPEQIVSHGLVAAGIQFFVQEGGALGAPLLGVTELKLALAHRDEFLRYGVRLLRGFITQAGFRLREQEPRNKFIPWNIFSLHISHFMQRVKGLD